MNILIFDMDGVMISPQGYHRALKETVRLAGNWAGYGEAILRDDQIGRFEALGISSEWHSSALCLAVMLLHQNMNKARGVEEKNNTVSLDLEDMFNALAKQPLHNASIPRGAAAIEELAVGYGVSMDGALKHILDSESIQTSLTMNWFEELILGSSSFSRIYKKKPQFATDSFLELYDEKLLDESMVEKIRIWLENPDNGAAIMTNRPSKGLSDTNGAQDAEMGSKLVGMDGLPLVGNGELNWMAEVSGRHVLDFRKPAFGHAFAAILGASGWHLKQSLTYAARTQKMIQKNDLVHLQNCNIIIFEDTPGGMVAVQAAADMLDQIGLKITLQKIGITEDYSKSTALAAQGGEIYTDINKALKKII